MKKSVKCLIMIAICMFAASFAVACGKVPPPAEPDTASITFTLPSGVTVSNDYETEYEVGEIIALPTDEEVSGLGEREIVGWYVSGTETEVESGVTTMPKGGIHIELRVRDITYTLSVVNETDAELSSGYKTEYKVGEVITLPNVTLPDGISMYGWCITGTDTEVESGVTTMPKGGLSASGWQRAKA